MTICRRRKKGKDIVGAVQHCSNNNQSLKLLGSVGLNYPSFRQITVGEHCSNNNQCLSFYICIFFSPKVKLVPANGVTLTLQKRVEALDDWRLIVITYYCLTMSSMLKTVTA